MTAAASQQTVAVKDATAIRRRRKRAPGVGGAADDCFTCSKRNVKCDRRRPYCSQCLELGNECSGYKTQLTWGVGVASRGKLRGLSLPVAKAPPVPKEPKKPAARRPRANSSLPAITTTWNDRDQLRLSPRNGIDIPSLTHTTPSPYQTQGYDYLSMSQPTHGAPSMAPNSWGGMSYSSSMAHSPIETTPRFSKFPLPIITDGLSSSVDSVSEVDYLSPLSQGYSRDDIPPFSHHHSSHMFEHYHGPQMSPIGRSPPPTLVLDTSPSMVYAPSEHSSSLPSHMDAFDTQMLQPKGMRECDSLSIPEVTGFSHSLNTTNPAWGPNHCKEEDIQSPLSENGQSPWNLVREPRQIRLNQELIAKMPFFMDYYKMTIAPAMVYLDDHYNPFRDHIMRLAGDSQSLQHAICALSACNLRMKRKLSLGQDTRDLYNKLIAEKQSMETLGESLPQDQSLAEEIQHRNLAVHLLNQQLNDPVKSSHDSVLATILILCHYRMAESGIAKFHTQFAGVKKILAMRRPQHFGGSSEDVAWMEALFIYFDAISATINDREAQLTPSGESQLLPPGSESLVGCDRVLFKTVSKLGRLNMLSQHRPVDNMADSLNDEQSPAMKSPMPPAARFDGNGFGSTLSEDELLISSMSTSAEYDDRRALFWKEWKEARQELQNWHFDAASAAITIRGSKVGHLRDLENLSEAFRYAALLYTERLASPSTPSSNTNFQNLVSQVVFYATSLEQDSAAEKFLLWPLFVVGSECVNELQQNIIRSKCKDIMGRSGYMNNLAALDVLERLWSGDFRNNPELGLYGQDGSKQGGSRGPFNWGKCFGGPGVGVEWIMF